MKKNAAFEKWAKGRQLSDVMYATCKAAFEAGQRASDPLRREKEAVVKAADAWVEGQPATALYESVWAYHKKLQSAQRSRRHGR